MTHALLTGDVAKLLGLSTSRVVQLDAALHPVREPSGRRRYAIEHVEAYRAARAAKVTK